MNNNLNYYLFIDLYRKILYNIVKGTLQKRKFMKEKIKKDLSELIRLSVIAIIYFYTMRLVFGTICYSRILIGIPCPFCGISRSLSLLLKGDFIGSFETHPLLILVFIGAGIFVFSRYTKHKNVIKIYLVLAFIAFIVLYVYRMEYMFPEISPLAYEERNALNLILEIQRRLS